MRIVKYKFWGSGESKWKFSEVELGKINLLVGDSGSGKSMFLNTIYKLARIAIGQEIAEDACWSVQVEQDGVTYGWEVETGEAATEPPVIVKERLWRGSGEETVTIVDRNERDFVFQEKGLPKLSRDKSSIALLQDEESVKPLYMGFRNILHRDFSTGELAESMKYKAIDPKLGNQEVEFSDLLHIDLGLNVKLYYLSRKFPDVFQHICHDFGDIFAFVKSTTIKDLSKIATKSRGPLPVPVFCIKETGVSEWIPAGRLSSGMQKVLLILTDIHTLSDGCIYLIDEYENSLGISAIDFLPELLNSVEKDVQFIITSHHPYIINKFPADDWFVFHRQGAEVTIRYGEENVKRFGRSKQQRFVQLINDPFYNLSLQ
ncbi:MAG: ATP-binding protein [Deltaproteobacteria bacterium]|nr:ATP-binding protein [Deltaproteobacteria bacterium]